jgi:choline dehydrogenase-like flavoprotein
LKYVTPEGIRADAANAFIHPLVNAGKHPNLHVLTESKVIRVLFDENKRAVGVECTTNPQYLLVNDDASKRQTFTVKARRLVVLSSGACGTPLTLQRSGVGDRAVLEKASVPIVADVKGVGAEYDDHTILMYPFQTNLSPDDTLDGLFSQRMNPEEAVKKGLLSWNGIDTHAKLRPTEEEVEALGPKFKALWDRDYRDHPNRPLIMMATGAA